MSFDVLTLGSITLDTFVQPQEVHIRTESTGDVFCFQVGEKVKVKTVAKHVGGGSANASVGFAIMGLSAAAYGTIGDDPHGDFIVHQLQKFNVDTNSLCQKKSAPSSYSIVFIFPDGRRTVFNEKTVQQPFAELRNSRVIYASHLSDEEEQSFETIIQWKKSTPERIFAWNPGKTQYQKGLSYYADLAKVTDLIVLNTEEAELFTGITAQKSSISDFQGTVLEKDLAQSLTIHNSFQQAQAFLDAGISRVIITDGKRGAQYFDATQAFCIPQLDQERAISTLGAGDSFSVGAVTALYRKKTPVDMLYWGSLNASSVVKFFGAQNGLLTETEITRLQSRRSKK